MVCGRDNVRDGDDDADADADDADGYENNDDGCIGMN